MNGLGFERYVANLLRAQGLTVYRSAASRGCADLVVSNDERQYLTVQCKKHGRVRYVRTEPDCLHDWSRTVHVGPVLTGPAKYVWNECTQCGARRLYGTTGSVLASAPSVGSPSSEREDEEASTA